MHLPGDRPRPLRTGLAKVHRLFAEAGLTDGVTFVGAGEPGLPEIADVAHGLGADPARHVGR